MPLTFPTNVKLAPRTINFVPKTLATSFSSPFTGKTQVVRYGGQYWQLDLTFAPLFTSDAEELRAFILSLNGMDGTFYFKLPSKFLMTGSVSPTITGDGNTFTGATGQLGKFGTDASYRLVQFTSTSTLFPRLPLGSNTISPTNGALFRLASNDFSWDVDAMHTNNFSLGIVEAI